MTSSARTVCHDLVMTASRDLPGRLASLVGTITATPGPVHVVCSSPVQLDLIARVCRESGAPLSIYGVAAYRNSAARDEVSRGATKGFLYAEPSGPSSAPLGPTSHQPSNTGTDPLHGRESATPDRSGAAVIRVRDIRDQSSDRVLVARIRTIVEEETARGVDLPALGVWPSGSRLSAQSRLLPGKALAHLEALGLGEDVAKVLNGPDGDFPPDLRPACQDLLGSWGQLSGRTRIGAVVSAPSTDHPRLVNHLASGIGVMLRATYAGELAGLRDARGPENAAERVRRIAGQLRLDPSLVDVRLIAGQHALLVGDRWVEGWTITVAGQLLLSAGALSVRPFTLSTGIRSARR